MRGSLPQPLLRCVRLAELRPTQMTVGLREVAYKRQQWRARTAKQGDDFLGGHMIPAVIGPKGRHWIIDNHHLARALHEEGVEEVLVHTVADLGRLRGRLFRTYMDNRNWLHPFDAQGRRRPLARLPKRIDDLTDDPYRSLAGALRRGGGFAKDLMPFAEFLWADFLRRRIDRARIDHQFDEAVQLGLRLCRERDAAYLPGWCGVDE